MLEMFDVGIDFLGLAELICPVKQHTKKKSKGMIVSRFFKVFLMKDLEKKKTRTFIEWTLIFQ